VICWTLCLSRSFLLTHCGRDREHVVCWTETSNTVSAARNATCSATTQTAEDFLHLDDTRAFRPIHRPRRRHPIPGITPSLLHNYNPRHCRVTTHSHCTILYLGESSGLSPLSKSANFEGQAKRPNGRSRMRCFPRCRTFSHELHRKCVNGWLGKRHGE